MTKTMKNFRGKERDADAAQGVAWRLMALFEAQLQMLPQDLDAEPELLAAQGLAMCGRDLAENLAHYLSGDVDHIPGLDHSKPKETP